MRQRRVVGYITSRAYFDFGARVLDPTTEFWVSMP